MAWTSCVILPETHLERVTSHSKWSGYANEMEMDIHHQLVSIYLGLLESLSVDISFLRAPVFKHKSYLRIDIGFGWIRVE